MPADSYRSIERKKGAEKSKQACPATGKRRTGVSAFPNLPAHCQHQQARGFYEYYRLFQRADESDDDEETAGSGKRGEVKGYTDGLHSPFGLFGQLKEKRGLTHDELLWSQPWIMYLLELSDAPRYVSGKPPAPVAESAEDINRILKGRHTNGTS